MEHGRFKRTEINFAERTFLETIFVPALGRGALKYIHPQFEIYDSEGKLRRIDFVVIAGKKRCAIEIDGYTYHGDRVSKRRFDDDRRRQNALMRQKWTVLRFTWNQVQFDKEYCRLTLKEFLGGTLEAAKRNYRKFIAISLSAAFFISAGLVLYNAKFKQPVRYEVVKSVISPSEARRFVNKFVTLRGRVTDTFWHIESNTVFLNFDSGDFACVIFKSSLPNFPFPAQSYYFGKEVEVKGVVKLYKGKPEIILNNQAQIRIIGESADK